MINIFETPKQDDTIENDFTGNQYLFEYMDENEICFISRGGNIFKFSLEYIEKKFSFVSPENH